MGNKNTNSRLLGLRCWQGQVRRQDGVGEDQDDGDDLRRAHQGGRKDHLPGRSFGFQFGSGININLKVHDEVKDKMFELELSWVGEFTDGVHKRVPEDVSLNVKYYMSFF